MYVLDTNVISELMRPAGAVHVFNWIAARPLGELFTTAVTQAEILFGLSLMPPGRRRSQLVAAAEAMFANEFAGRVLTFDAAASRHYADIRAGRQFQGAPISVFDAQIAAIVRCHEAVLITRNVADFRECGITIINPWTED